MSKEKVEAISYDLSFHFTKDLAYSCHEKVEMVANEEIETFSFHADSSCFKVESLEVSNEGKKLSDVSFSVEELFLKLNFSEKIKGKIQVEILVKGKVNQYDCQGIFISDNVIYTQFEKNFTQKVFPCIEKNSSKATYQLNIQVPKRSFIVSNTDIIEEKIHEDNEKIVTFEKTVPLPSYVIGFAFGNLRKIAMDSYDNIPLSVIAKKSFDGDYILKILKEGIQLCETHFGVKLTDMKIKKLDIVILPKFKCVAMENHGCIFLSEPLCQNLDDERLPGLIVHEIVHYWFGNYLSMPTWIKEGITTYYQFIFTNEIIKREYYQFEDYDKEPERPTEKDFQKIYYYGKSLKWVDYWIRIISREEFEKRLKIIFKENPFGYINEDDFLKRVIFQ